MKTVLDYKQLGLVFIQGDYINTHEGKKQEPLNRYGVGYCNDSRSNDEKFVIEFAWRNNDGVKTEYKGLIHAMLENGAIIQDFAYSLYYGSSFNPIIQWRPVVLQSDDAKDNNDESFTLPIGIESPELREAFKSLKDYLKNKQAASPKEDKPMKPVYTAEMHAKKELPPVGAKCIYVFNDDEEYVGEIAAMDGDACWFKRSEFGYKTFIGKHKFKPIIKTIKVNGFDVPAPMSEAPEYGQMVYLAHAAHLDFNLDFTWQGDDASVSWLSRGMVHSTESAAIAHAKAMLGINPNPARSGDGYDRNVLGQNNEGDEI